MRPNCKHILNRELSLLEFHARVLEEAADRTTPLLERLKFLAIFSGNMDEFFMVRVAGIATKDYENDSRHNTAEILDRIGKRTKELILHQYHLFYQEVLPGLEHAGIKILKWEQLTASEKKIWRKEFISGILPVLTPVGIDPAHPFPLLPNLGLEFLIRVRRPGDLRDRFAVLEIPQSLPRFLEMEGKGKGYRFLPLDELISGNIDLLFNGCEIRECSTFRVTRDMNFSIDDNAAEDLLEEMRDALQRNAKRPIIRLELSSSMSLAGRRWLSAKIGLSKENIYTIDGLINLKSCFQLCNLPLPGLLYPPMPPLPSIHVPERGSMFDVIRAKGAFLVHHPYETFEPVLRFLEEAAEDPDVLAIKQTLYRVSGNSPIVKALMRAAQNGKQVTVLVELKARFDEENNINWALELDRAGAHVIYGVANLKVHCKNLLVVRREQNRIRRYVHIGTGNYNDKTARQYTDLGYFTNDETIAEDCSSLFNVITGFSIPPVWNRLLVAPYNLRTQILALIDREARYSTQKNPGSIRIKANGLIDSEIIRRLYHAAEKHVKIELAIRGICGIDHASLPQKIADNITVVSVIDRFLEHSRIFRFGNRGKPEYYIGSADLMQRNLRRRIEILVPIEQPECRKELDLILSVILSDCRKGRHQISGYHYSETWHGKEEFETTRTQYVLYDYYRKRLSSGSEPVIPEQPRKKRTSKREKLS